MEGTCRLFILSVISFLDQVKAEVPGVPTLNIVPSSGFAGKGPQITLNCSVGFLGVPEATEYVWLRDGNNHTRQSGSILSLNTYTVADDDGTFTCRAVNSVGEGNVSNSVQLTVKEAPSVQRQLPATSTAAIHITGLIATCEFRSKPGCRINWKYNGTTILPAGVNQKTRIGRDEKYTMTSSELTWNLSQSQDTRIHARGTYQCIADLDGQEQGTRFMTLDPQYGPLNMTINGTDEETVQEGTTVTRYCQAFCKPSCSYTWRSVGKAGRSLQIMSNNAVLELTNVTKQHIARYQCRANNSHGELRKIFKLDVHYSPVSVSLTSNVASPLQGDIVTLSCSVDSNPTSTITITNKTKSLEPDSSNTDNEDFSSSKVLTDIGCYKMQFECQAENNISRVLGRPPVNHIITIDVECSPRIYYTDPVDRMVLTSIGKDTETIEIGLLANPFPDIQRQHWLYIPEGTTTSTVLPDNVLVTTPNGNTLRLVILEVLKENLGNYTLTAGNKLGSMNYSFSVQLESVGIGLVPGVPVAGAIVLLGIIIGVIIYATRIKKRRTMKNQQAMYVNGNVNVAFGKEEKQDDSNQDVYEAVAMSSISPEPSVYTGLTFESKPLKPPQNKGKDGMLDRIRNLHAAHLTPKPQPKPSIMSSENIEMHNLVSSGNFYEIWTATIKHKKPSSTSYIIKKVKEYKTEDSNPYWAYLSEQADLLIKLKSTQFVKCLGKIQDGSCSPPLYMMILEEASHGSLYKYLTNQPVYDNIKPTNKKPEFANFISQIVSAVVTLNNKSFPVLHYCLSVHHVLLTDSKKCKLTGFSTPEAVRAREKYEQDNKLPRPLRWLAPEAIDCEHVVESDIWSLGVCIWQILSGGETPHKNVPDDTIDPSKFARFLRKPSNCNREMYDILLKCWLHEPKQRISFSDILASCQLPSIYEDV